MCFVVLVKINFHKYFLFIEINLQQECQQDRQASVNGGQLINDTNNDISTPRSRANMKVISNPSSAVCEIKSKHSFITDRYNPKPLSPSSSSPMSFTRSILNEMVSPRKTPRNRHLKRSETIKEDSVKDHQKENEIKIDNQQTLPFKTSNLPSTEKLQISHKQKPISATQSLNEDLNKHSKIIIENKNESMSLKESLDLEQYFSENKKDRDQLTKEFKEFLKTSLCGTNLPAEPKELPKDKETMKIQLNDEEQIVKKFTAAPASVDQKDKTTHSKIVSSPEKIRASLRQTSCHTNLTSGAPSTRIKTKSSLLLISPPKSKSKQSKKPPPVKTTNSATKRINSTTSLKSTLGSSKTRINNTNLTKELMPKEKSKPWYDVEKTQQFMAEQRKRRKVEAKLTNKNKIEREDIKKRLNELRKSSLQIVAKNVKKVQKNASKKMIRIPETMEAGKFNFLFRSLVPVLLNGKS